MIFLPAGILLIIDLVEWKSYLVVVLISLPSFIYKPFMESLKGATLGKMACGLRVIDENGGNLPLGKAYLRSLPNLASLVVAMLSYALWFADPAFLEATSVFDIMAMGRSNELAGPSFVVQLFLLIDCLIVAFNPQKRALHDYLAGSFCVRDGAAPAPEAHNGAPEAHNGAPEAHNGAPEAHKGDDAFYCSNCDAEIPRDAHFCPNCGTKFE